MVDVEQSKNRLFRDQAELASSRGGAGLNTIHPASGSGSRGHGSASLGANSDLPLVDVVQEANGARGKAVAPLYLSADDNPHEANK